MTSYMVLSTSEEAGLEAVEMKMQTCSLFGLTEMSGYCKVEQAGGKSWRKVCVDLLELHLSTCTRQ